MDIYSYSWSFRCNQKPLHRAADDDNSSYGQTLPGAQSGRTDPRDLCGEEHRHGGEYRRKTESHEGTFVLWTDMILGI